MFNGDRFKIRFSNKTNEIMKSRYKFLNKK